MPKKNNSSGKISKNSAANRPRYFYTVEIKDGKEIYRNQSGEIKSVAQYERSKRKLYRIDKKGKIYEPEKVVKLKEGKARRAKQERIIETQIFGYDFLKTFTEKAKQGENVFVIFKGQSYKIKPESIANFILFWNDIFSNFMAMMKKILPSPILLLGYTEMKNSVIFNLDSLTMESFDGLEEDELKDEFPEIKNTIRNYKALVTRRFREYFNI